MTANARRWISLALWAVMLTVFGTIAVRAVHDARHPVAAAVSFAIVAIGGMFCALSELFATPFDDARFERRINRHLSANRNGEEHDA